MELPSNSLPPVERVASVDTLRGLTILLMVFVNDLSSAASAAPSWMLHIQPPDAEGMTLAYIVFPGFLFIAGVSIAGGRRQSAVRLPPASNPPD